MIFFLPQVLPDKILAWIGGGLSSIGDSTAISTFQSALSARFGSGQHKGNFRSGSSKSSKGVPRVGDGKKDSLNNGAGSNTNMTNPQGVTPNDTAIKE